MRGVRTTQHNGRTNKHGQVFSARHNDREGGFNAEHIDATRTANNWTWTRYKGAPSFESCEEVFYERHFADGLTAKNARYEQNRHAERVQTLEQYRHAPRTCPEESIIQIGKIGDSVDAETLLKAFNEEFKWEQKKFPQVAYLDVAVHIDEPNAAPHIHARRVWIAHDKEGREIVGQNGALREMGVSRPDPNKAESRYNNAKQTYTEQCRTHFQQICKEMGLFIEEEPREPGRSGLSLAQLKADTAAARAAEAEERARIATAPAQNPQKPPRTPLFHPDRITIDRSEYDALRALAGQAEQAKRDAEKAAKDRRAVKKMQEAAEKDRKAAEAARTSAERDRARIFEEARKKAVEDARSEAARIISEAEEKAHSVDLNLKIGELKIALSEYKRFESRHPEFFKQMRQEERREKSRSRDKGISH